MMIVMIGSIDGARNGKNQPVTFSCCFNADPEWLPLDVQDRIKGSLPQQIFEVAFYATNGGMMLQRFPKIPPQEKTP